MNRLAPGRPLALSRPAEATSPREVGPGRLALSSPVCDGGSTGPPGGGALIFWNFQKGRQQR